jgi:hypothetical protein
MKLSSLQASALAILALGASGYFFFRFVTNGAATYTPNVAEIPCDQVKWERKSEFDSALWKLGRDREKVVHLLDSALRGKSRQEVESQLGAPDQDPRINSLSSYQYMIGKFDMLRCGMALSVYLHIYFDEKSKVSSTELRRVH